LNSRNAKKRAIRKRIEAIEAAIARAQEYLQCGKHADWSGFRPWFHGKQKDGRELPPHRDWVRNVFMPRQVKALNRSAGALERLSQEYSRTRANTRLQRTPLRGAAEAQQR